MPTGFTYSTFSNSLAAMMVIDTTNDTDWTTYLPSIIDGAELRILRDLDPLVARKNETATFGSSAPSNARIAVPSDLVVMREFGYYTPAGTSADGGGTWVQLFQVKDTWLREYWPSRALTSPPLYYALMDNAQLIVAPSPDATYNIEMFLTYRPTPLSVSNTSTWIASNVPDLFIYAAAVVASGYLKNYGALADDPQAPVTWEKMYQKYLGPAVQEESRRKAEGWSDDSQSKPPRLSPTQ